jgi:NADPH:quinone reductase-like Zn-dependent oxidoreductase
VTNTSPGAHTIDEITGEGLTRLIARSSSSAAAVDAFALTSGRRSPQPRSRRRRYAALLPLIVGGEIVPAFDRSFPLEEAPRRLRHLIEDRPFGKVTLTVGAHTRLHLISGRWPSCEDVRWCLDVGLC